MLSTKEKCFCHMQFFACVSVYCACICQIEKEMAGNDYGIININSFHRFSGFVNLIKSLFLIFYILSFFLISGKKFIAQHKSRQKFNDSTVSWMPQYWFRSNICHFISRTAYICTSFKLLKNVSGATKQMFEKILRHMQPAEMNKSEMCLMDKLILFRS